MKSHDKTRVEVIESFARFIQLELWNLRAKLWSHDVPVDPVQVLEPGVALEHRGFKVLSGNALGEIHQNGRRGEAAGLIDHATNTVRISSQYSPMVQRFTAAHELGHAVLHAGYSPQFRDLPLDGPAHFKDPMERDADRFAVAFLMPRKLVRQYFFESFGCQYFELNDETAFALMQTSLDRVAERVRSKRQISRWLATASQYGGREIPRLTSIFGVSPEAMAIRLEELRLV